MYGVRQIDAPDAVRADRRRKGLSAANLNGQRLPGKAGGGAAQRALQQFRNTQRAVAKQRADVNRRQVVNGDIKGRAGGVDVARVIGDNHLQRGLAIRQRTEQRRGQRRRPAASVIHHCGQALACEVNDNRRDIFRVADDAADGLVNRAFSEVNQVIVAD
ncbi:hypothetical protein BN131_1461 [Cronobacter malonaticus 681]|nr:hypothetical protein BN131_1461 [Cronobacter malonaticus 681]